MCFQKQGYPREGERGEYEDYRTEIDTFRLYTLYADKLYSLH